jgi:SAM-dependent methyltransferase
MEASATTPKPAGYYDLERADVVAELPRPIGRALDVGCGAGGVGLSLKAAGAESVTGIEVNPDAAAVARTRLDAVHEMPVEEAIAAGVLRGPFDTICTYDVLEHLVDPEPVLRALLGVAAPGGRLHVSIPNARHFTLLRDLLFRGTFGYTEFGHRDVTHLRWYTRRDLIALVSRCGWQVRDCDGSFSGRDRYADKATFGRAREFLTVQWHLLATAP